MFWIVVIVFLALAVYGFYEAIKFDKEEKAKGRIFVYTKLEYLGGLPTIAGGKDAMISVYNNHLEILIQGNGKMNVNIEDVVNAEIQSQQSIQSEVSLGNIIFYGAYAFGMRDSKTVVNNYLVLTYNDNDEKRTLIFQTDKLENIVREIRSLINKD